MILVKAFVIGGLICVLAQLMFTYTKLTPGHVLVLFVMGGALLEGLGLYRFLLEFAGAGALIPVSGFGSSITRGVISEVDRLGWEGIFTGVFELTGLGLAAAIILGSLFAVVAKPKD